MLQKYIVCDVCRLTSPSFQTNSVIDYTSFDPFHGGTDNARNAIEITKILGDVY